MVTGRDGVQDAHGDAAFRSPALGAQEIGRRAASEADRVREATGGGEIMVEHLFLVWVCSVVETEEHEGMRGSI